MPTTPGESFTQTWKHSTYSPNLSTPPDWAKDMDETGYTASETLLVYEPPTRLVYTFGKCSEVEFVLKPQGDQVLLTLTHSKVTDTGMVKNISAGWHAHLDVLEMQLKHQTPPGFWDVFRPYEGTYDKRYS